jgi:5-methylcytosine-specific restriction endonuclease McrA
MKRYRVESADRLRDQRIDYYSRNRSAVLARHRNTYARRKGAGQFVSDSDWTALKAVYGNRCVSCHKAESEVTLSADHIVPLSRGGTNHLDNLQPLCQRCNNRKYVATMFPARRLATRETHLVLVEPGQRGNPGRT